MTNISQSVLALAVPASALLLMVSGSVGQGLQTGASVVVAPTTTDVALPLPTLQKWMSPDLTAAWAKYQGQGTTITMVDDFTSNSTFSGNFNGQTQTQMHGQWTTEEARLIAPLATVATQDFNTGVAVPLKSGTVNVLNLSYAMYARAGYSVSQLGWSPQEASIIADATNGLAVISKAAGNDSVAIGYANWSRQMDYLDVALVGAPTAIFVGALNTNGSTAKPASLAYYSNSAGSNKVIQSHFLVVGVDGTNNGQLLGTSFAAPIITGYAAILGSKFRGSSSLSITNQLLKTARTDTLLHFNAQTYGMGEASLSRALAPNSIQ